MPWFIKPSIKYPGLLLSTWTWPGFRCCCIICLGVWNQYRIWGSRRVTRSMGLCDTYNLLLNVFRLLRHVLDHRGFGAYKAQKCRSEKRKKSDFDFATMAVLHSHYHFWWCLVTLCTIAWCHHSYSISRSNNHVFIYRQSQHHIQPSAFYIDLQYRYLESRLPRLKSNYMIISGTTPCVKYIFVRHHDYISFCNSFCGT